MQRDAADEAQAVAGLLRYNRTIAIVHHSFTLLAGFVAYSVLLFGFLFADKYPKCGAKITIAASALSASILVVSTILKRDRSFLAIMDRITSRVASTIQKARQENPFFVLVKLGSNLYS